jgi:twitching motility protein PilT
MALVESLLTAIARADGDALVMHVGEKPYVVASAGPIELSSQALNLQAMAGMVAQLLPDDAQRALTEFGAVEHELPPYQEMSDDRFSIVVARGGDDVWIELRRHRGAATAVLIDAVGEEAPAPSALAPAEPNASAPTDHVAEPEATEHAPSVYTAGGYQDASDAGSGDSAFTSYDAPQVQASSPQQQDSHVTDAHNTSEPTSTPVHTSAPSHAPAFASSMPAADAAAAHAHAEAQVDSRPEPVLQAVVGIAVTRDDHAASYGEPTGAYSRDEQNSNYGESTSAPATVIPMTRTLRIEVPQSTSSRHAARGSNLERLLGIAAAKSATALYLTTQTAPHIRVDADVRALDGEPALSGADVEALTMELMPEAARDAFRRGEPTEFVAEVAGLGQVRGSTFRDHRGPGVLFQLVSMRPLGAEQLGLTPEVSSLATEGEGLVLVAAPNGNGKTTLLGALVDSINRVRANYVITLERQIRLVHDHRSALISQRELSGTPEQMLASARGALRETPDILVIEELASAEMFELALEAAGSGVLVLVSVTASSTAAALSRVLELVPQDKRREMQARLAERFRGAVAQVLLRNVTGGRVAAREVLLTTAAVTRILAEGQWHELPNAMTSGRKFGLISLTDALVTLVRNGSIDLREAYRKADDRDALLAALKREHIDTSAVDRLLN